MDTENTDWRLLGQESYLQEAELTRKPYRAKSETSEHDHCAFCWTKLMDPNFSETHRQHIADHPDATTEGYTSTAAHERGAEYHWICPACFDDFSERFAWRLTPPIT